MHWPGCGNRRRSNGERHERCAPRTSAHAAAHGAQGDPMTSASADAAAPPVWRLHAQLTPVLNLQQDSCVDAVLAWDLLTRFARHGGPSALDHWPVLLEFGLPRPAESMAAWCSLPETAPHRALLHAALAASLGRAADSVVHTALLPDALLPALLAGVRSGALRRFQLGQVTNAPATRSADQTPTTWPLTAPAGVLHTLGLIGDGCCLAHHDFRSPGGESRLLAVWDQTPEAPPRQPWQRYQHISGPPPYDYGMELAQPDLTELLARHSGLGEAQERLAYAAIDRPSWGAAGHRTGAGMMHLLAGTASQARPLAGQTDGSERTASVSKGEHDAVRMPLIFVQLPCAGPGRSANDAMAMHMVDGARYIVERTHASAGEGSDWTTTLCIPPGAVTGPHDGSSMAELALDQLAADARVRLVVAAGDSADRGWHARQSVHQTSPGQFWLRLPPGRREDTLMQLWLPEGQSIERFQLQIKGPGLPASPLLRVGRAATLARPDQLPVAGVVWPTKAAQGLHGSLVLVALAATDAAPAAMRQTLCPPGLWLITLHAAGDAPADVHAWLDCADAPPAHGGPPVPAQPRFERSGTQGAGQGGQLSTGHSWGGLAHGQLCTVAMGYEQASLRVDSASANGPRRSASAHVAGANPRQQCYAPVSRSPSLPGLVVPGFFSGQISTLTGTRAAAAQVARWLAEDRLTEEANALLRPAKGGGPLPEGARCLPPRA